MTTFASKQAPLLFAVLEYGEFPELLRVAGALHGPLQRPVVFWFVKASYRRLAQDTAAVAAQGFAWLDADGRRRDQPANEVPDAPAPEAPPSKPQRPVRLPEMATGRSAANRWASLAALPMFALAWGLRDVAAAARRSARDVQNFRRDVRRFRDRLKVVRAVLESTRPALVVVGQDVPATDLAFLLIAAGERGIPRLMTPFAMFSLNETADYALAQTDHGRDASAMNAWVAARFPHWLLRWRGADLLRLPGPRALALEWTGLVRGLPWTPLSEPVEALTAESEVAAKALATLGVPRDRIAVVGSPVHDRLAAHLAGRATLRQQLCVEHGLDPARPLLVCGWPANLFPWLAGRRIAFGDYPQVAQAWASALAQVRRDHGVNVLVSVHPKTLPGELQAAREQRLPSRIGGADELIAAGDLFTTLNGSSITAWAIAAGVPVLLFDCFETRYPDFDDVPGCVQVQDEAGFRSELSRLCGDAAARGALAERQRSVASRWGVLDGRAGERLAAVARRLVEAA